MDFTFNEEQDALDELAEQIFTGSSGADRVADVEATDERFDRELWSELAKAQLLGTAIPEEHGGLGFGIVELARVLEQQGRRVAPVPMVPTLVMAALPITEFGSPEQQSEWLPVIARGDAVLTAAFAELGSNNVYRSAVTATETDGGYRLDGVKIAVPAAAVAQAVLVPAMVGDDLSVFVVPMDASGLGVALSETTNRELHGTLEFDGVSVGSDTMLGGVGQGAEIVTWTIERVQVASSALVLGCCEESLTMAAAYTSEREQFGRPLSTNQGVVLRAASCYIAIEAQRVTLWQAAWRLAEGLPAARQVEVAKWWAAEGGQQVVHDTQHLHGGMGSDVDYPVHRYFLWVKQIENTFGGASQQLSRLGARIAVAAKTAAGTT